PVGKSIEAGKTFLGAKLTGKRVKNSEAIDSTFNPNSNESRPATLVFKSADGGQSWKDISQGLPEKLKGGGFFTNESGLYLRDGNGMYHNRPNSTSTNWKKENFPDKQNIAAGKTGIFAYNYDGQFLEKQNGISKWRPMYTNFKGKEVRTVFETAGGTVLISSGNSLFKSTNNGETWKQVHMGGWVKEFVESNGVLLATSQRGILRSTDDAENWEEVISEGGVGIDVEQIKGGFAAITYNSLLKSRRVRASYDGGKNWHFIDAGLPAQGFIASFLQPVNTGLPMEAFITSIVQVGEDFFCAHGTGIFRSSDKGKTWKLILPSNDKKVFNLSVSGNVIYAIAGNGGC
ncbi:MAG TPA: exo-alpha-sialidase, partial [Pedobacter sp.]